MTARTPLATLTMARNYLDKILASSTSGPWTWCGNDIEGGGREVVIVADDYHQTMTLEDGNLIVALHATAPAIRDLLSVYIDWLNLQESGTHASCLGVAEALLSTSHAAQWIADREAK